MNAFTTRTLDERRTRLDLGQGDVMVMDHRQRLMPNEEEELRRIALQIRDLIIGYHVRLIQIGPSLNIYPRDTPHGREA